MSLTPEEAARLAHGDEARSQLVGNRPSEDEPARLDTRDLRDPSLAKWVSERRNDPGKEICS